MPLVSNLFRGLSLFYSFVAFQFPAFIFYWLFVSVSILPFVSLAFSFASISFISKVLGWFYRVAKTGFKAFRLCFWSA